MVLAVLFSLIGFGQGMIGQDQINDSLEHYGTITNSSNGTYEYVDFAGYSAILDATGQNWTITYWMPACCAWNVKYAQWVFKNAGAKYFGLVPEYGSSYYGNSPCRLGLRKVFPAPDKQGDLSSIVNDAEHYNLKDENHMHLREVLMNQSLWAENELEGL